ncbi:MAG: chorismate synthase [Clostridia bacterium]|nr:chorismate synthase [Clostridia bacterium]
MSYDFGSKIKCTVFGKSHAPEIGVDIEGFPKGITVDFEKIDKMMSRRAPGKNAFSTPRREADKVEITSGVVDGITDGNIIHGVIKNTNTRSTDYSELKYLPRPGHADYTAFVKYNGKNDMRGGGQFSGRLTAPLVFAGALCSQILEQKGIEIYAHISEIAGICDEQISMVNPCDELKNIANKEFPVLSDDKGEEMKTAIENARKKGDSVGGIVECFVMGLPVGLGGALSEGLEGEIAKAIFGIPAVKGVEFGAGFNASRLCGSENNDNFAIKDGKVVTETNNCGGILGGISNGMPLVFRVAFKPTPSISIPQKTVNLETLEEAEITIQGRHDPCVVPRAVPVVEAVCAIVLAGLL